MTVYQFIELVFLNQYKDVLKHPYIAFSLIFNSIEFLGKCLNKDPNFDLKGDSYSDFDNSIKTLFDLKYHDLSLYDPIRNGFAHSVRPKAKRKVRLHSRKQIGETKVHIPNLTKTSDDQYILFVEDFYEDFSNACKKLLEKIDQGELQNPKLFKNFIETKTYQPMVINGEIIFKAIE